MVREIAELAPMIACTSRALVLHIMETTHHNWICPFHHERDKRGLVHDSTSTRRFNVTGTPFKRRVNAGKAKDKPSIIRKRGYFHCGCHEDHVLADFYWWKTGRIQSAKTEETEGWETQRLDPRARALVFNMWKDSLYLNTIDEEIYRGLPGSPSTELRVLDSKIARLQARRDQISHSAEIPVQGKVSKSKAPVDEVVLPGRKADGQNVGPRGVKRKDKNKHSSVKRVKRDRPPPVASSSRKKMEDIESEESDEDASGDSDDEVEPQPRLKAKEKVDIRYETLSASDSD